MNQKGWHKQVGWLYVLPAMLLLLTFLIIPFCMSINYSFTDYNMLTPGLKQFVGFRNYLQTLKDPVFLKSLRNILQFVVFIIPIQLGMA